MTSKEVMQEYFPTSKCVPFKGPEGTGFLITWNGFYVPGAPIPIGIDENHAWDLAVKHKTTRERFLAYHQGRLIKFLNESDSAESMLDIAKQNDQSKDLSLDLNYEDMPKIQIEPEKVSTKIDINARDW